MTTKRVLYQKRDGDLLRLLLLFCFFVSLVLACDMEPNDTGLEMENQALSSSLGTQEWRAQLQSFVHSQGVAADSQGNTYTVGSFRNNVNDTYRFIRRYDENGSNVQDPELDEFGSNDWFITFSAPNADITWQKVVVDENEQQLYILFSLHSDTYPINYSSLHLVAHSLVDGNKLWGSYFVGSTQGVQGGLDIDSEGNIWAVGEDISPPRRMIRLHKYAPDGTLLDTTLVGDQLADLSYLAFATDRKRGVYYLASEKTGSAGTRLTVTKSNNDGTFLGSYTDTIEIMFPEVGYLNLEPIYQKPVKIDEGVVDKRGRFVLAGHANFAVTPPGEFFPAALTIPFLLSIKKDLNENFRHLNLSPLLRDERKTAGVYFDTSAFSLAAGEDGNTYVLLRGSNLLYVLNIDGDLVSTGSLLSQAPLETFYPSLNCGYLNTPDIFEWSDLAWTSSHVSFMANHEIRKSHLVSTGRILLAFSNHRQCPNSDIAPEAQSWAATASYEGDGNFWVYQTLGDPIPMPGPEPTPFP